MKILFSGGGTLGPVTPLLAIKESIDEEHANARYIWVGTKNGPEQSFLEQSEVPFYAISSGKLRRYVSFWNVVDLFKIATGFVQSYVLLRQEKPDVCVSAGGFVSVPVHWAAYLLGIPTWVHQQDVRVGLANRLMAPMATKITTVLESHVDLFGKKRSSWLGNPIREEILSGSKKEAKKLFDLDDKLPVVFATGGGTGSLRVNQMVVDSLESLKGKAQIIHLTGKSRSQDLAKNAEKHFENYHVYTFFADEMKHAYAAADVVVSRGGFGTLSELAALEKPSILVPKTGHQDENVFFLSDNNAVLSVNETSYHRDVLGNEILALLDDMKAAKRMAERLQKILPTAKKADILNIINELTK
jgi:UDP-N-acetylglucosamine--N-acetylmuramyl-(pentapeptide) pyrophosphoryl-undecaprenol N-acetylglucosamine transferase